MKISRLFIISACVACFCLPSVQAMKITSSVDQDTAYDSGEEDYVTTRTQMVNVDFSIDDEQALHLWVDVFSSLQTDVDRIDIHFANLTTQEHLQAFQEFLDRLQASCFAQRTEVDFSGDHDQENPLLLQAHESLEKYQSLIDRIVEEKAERAARRAQHQEEHPEEAAWGYSLSSGDDDSDY